MTSKDLNLTLDQRLTTDPAGERGEPLGKLARMQAPPLAANSSATGKSPRQAAQTRGPLAALTLVVMLLNILALAGGAYWLYFRFQQTPPAAVPVQAVIDPALERAVTMLERSLSDLDSKVAQLQLSQDEQLLLINSALLDIEQQLGTLRPALDTAPASSAASAAPAPPDQWLINAGTFSRRDQAQQLVQQLTGMGYEARLAASVAGEGEPHRVQVTGFTERTAAEEAARLIVEQTDLNGLWVWKGD